MASPSDLAGRAPDLRRAAVQVFRDPRERRVLGPLRSDAVVALLAKDPQRAVARLARAAAIAPRNAVVASDLAAARLQLAAAISDPYELRLALAAAERAADLDPGLLAARYNRALALARLTLDEAARADWRRYLAAERDPCWRAAGETQAARLPVETAGPPGEERVAAAKDAAEHGNQERVHALVAEAPEQFRELVERKLLPDWAQAEASGRKAEASRLLRTARAIARALAAVNGERLAADTVAQIERSGATPGRRSGIVRGLQEHGRGLALSKKGDFARALPRFAAARRLLSAYGSPFAGWAAYEMAVCRYQLDDYRAALTLLRPLVQDSCRERSVALHGRALWQAGLIRIIQGDPVAALTADEAALEDFRRLRESTLTARLAGQVANALSYLGRPREAWRRLYPALIDPSARAAPYTRFSLCETAAEIAIQEGEHELALRFQDEVLRSAQVLGAFAAVPALRGRGAILASLGAKREAADALEKAEGLMGQISDPAVRRTLVGDLDLLAADLTPALGRKLALLDEAIASYRSSSFHYGLAQALYARALAEIAAARNDAAERDLRAALGEFERQRETIAAPEDRTAYFDRTRETLDRMVDFQMRTRRRPAAAFRYGEQAKARTLLDWILLQPSGERAARRAGQIARSPSDPAALARQLPPGVAVVEYSTLPDSLVVWILRSPRTVAVETVPVSARALADLVHRLRRELDGGRGESLRGTSSRLYEILVRPLERHLAAQDRIAFVPDGELHNLPFALLRDARTGRYLVRDHPCSIAPSVKILLASLRRDRALATGRGLRALAIASPSFDRGLFPSLATLEATTAESDLGNLFPGSVVLSDRAATRDAFLREAGHFEIVHFGGHSVVNAEYPLLSQMLFAAAPGDPVRGVLYSRDVLGRHFPRTRLAVLASCSTAAGKISRTEGVESLARPFLAAGVPAVVASLWDVGDQATAEFFARFYRHLRQAYDPARALQAAQIESLESGANEVTSPRTWASFELIGASAASRGPTRRRGTTPAASRSTS